MRDEPRRIQLHDHADGNSGGKLAAAATTTTAASGGTSSTGGSGGFDGIAEDLATVETDTTKRLAPDGTGGVDWVTASASPGFLTNTEGGQAAVVTNVAAGSAATLDLALGNTFDLTLTANCTVTITDPPPAGVEGKITVILRQGGSGTYTVTWPASVVWQAADGTATGSAPTLHTVVGAEDVVTLATLDGGTTWGGELGGSSSGVTGFATPAIVLGTAAAAGVATTAIRSDSTIVAFDATAPTTQALGDAAATGSAAKAAHRDHLHGMPALSSATPLVESGSGSVGTAVPSSREDHVHPAAAVVAFTIIGQETRVADGSTVAWALDNDFEANSCQAFNLTSGKALVVTETLPNTVTIGAAGSAGDILSFAYAASAI